MSYKTLIPQQIYLLIGLSVVLNFGRVVLFNNWSLIYLLWNLFLAFLPFIVSLVLLRAQQEKKLGRFLFIAGTIIWLLLLPNAPYIITDLVHIGYGNASILFYNTVLIFVCALTGLVLGLYSLSDMHHICTQRYGRRVASIFLIASMLLTSFGVSLGRFLRFNSWDIFVNVNALLTSIGRILWYPHLYVHVYIVTCTLFLLLFVCYSAWGFNSQKEQ